MRKRAKEWLRLQLRSLVLRVLEPLRHRDEYEREDWWK